MHRWADKVGQRRSQWPACGWVEQMRMGFPNRLPYLVRCGPFFLMAGVPFFLMFGGIFFLMADGYGSLPRGRRMLTRIKR